MAEEALSRDDLLQLDETGRSTIQPVLLRKEDRRSLLHQYPDLPWRTVHEGMDKRWNETDEKYDKRVRKKLLERWGHCGLFKLINKSIANHRRTIELLEELMMSILARLDVHLPLRKEKTDGS